jgi:hypothetical protein
MKRRRASTMLSVRESVPRIIRHLGNRPQGQSNRPKSRDLTQARGILPAPGRERALAHGMALGGMAAAGSQRLLGSKVFSG